MSQLAATTPQRQPSTPALPDLSEPSTILVIGSKHRFAMMIAVILELAGLDLKKFVHDTNLDIDKGMTDYLASDEPTRIEIRRMAGVHGRSNLPADDARNRAAALLRQYRSLNGQGDFHDFLLNGSTSRLKRIRGGDEKAFLFAIATVARAQEIARLHRSGEYGTPRDTSHLMVGVRVDIEQVLYFRLDLPDIAREALDKIAWGLTGLKRPTPKRRTLTERRRFVAFFPVIL